MGPCLDGLLDQSLTSPILSGLHCFLHARCYGQPAPCQGHRAKPSHLCPEWFSWFPSRLSFFTTVSIMSKKMAPGAQSPQAQGVLPPASRRVTSVAASTLALSSVKGRATLPATG